MMMTMMTSSSATTASTLTDCSSMQGSTTSSASSDVMTLTTTAASSWCAIPASSRLRVLRLVRPHQRRLLVVPERSAAYGFAVRGGKEHGTGFFVSHVEHGGEAQLKGLRIGDQVLRINGFRLDDAVHKEFIQLVASQDRIILKVRGVGMLPVKDQADERLSWCVVKVPSVSGTPSESSYRAAPCSVERGRAANQRQISVVLHVAPRTKLGLGICKGPEWKPGIFVQFTKERSVAREAGLRPGDQILSVNSIDFSDVLFSEAVAVMKGTSKLDMIVRTAAGCDLFPGESSGYNSSASSVTGDQSPCWADAKSKRLTAVREEPSAATPAATLSTTTTTAVQAWAHGVEVHKQLNKTIIKLSENGTSINNTFIAASSSSSNAATMAIQGQQAVAPPPPPPLQGEMELPRPQAAIRNSNSSNNNTASRSTIKRNNVRPASNNSVTIPPPTPKQPMQPQQQSSKSETSGGGSSLSSAITEELKKRKEKQQQQQQQHRSHSSHFNRDRNEDRPQSSHHNGNHNGGASLAIARQVSHKQRLSAAAPHGSERSSNNSSGGGGGGGGGDDQHTALMDEFKRAHQRMFRNGFHESEHKERGETLKRTSIMPDESCYRNNNINNGNSAPELPPPPPQFANPQAPQLKLNGSPNKAKQQQQQLSSSSYVAVRPPATPLPDYDAVQQQQQQHQRSNGQSNGQRRTLRLGTVTIGEYNGSGGGSERDKRETLQRATLKKASSNGEQQQQHQRHCSNYENGGSNSGGGGTGILKNGSRSSSASFSRQHTEKSIKFGN